MVLFHVFPLFYLKYMDKWNLEFWNFDYFIIGYLGVILDFILNFFSVLSQNCVYLKKMVSLLVCMINN